MNEPLLDFSLQVVQKAVLNGRVRDYWRGDGWRFEELVAYLSTSLLS